MFTLNRRIEVEKLIIESAIRTAIAQGFVLRRVHHEDAVNVATVEQALAEAFVCDDAHIIFDNPLGPDGKSVGSAWIHAVYGNSGWDVISDYTTNLDDVIKAIDPLVTQFETEDSQ